MYNICYKKEYTREECEECFKWFEERMDVLPASIQLPPSEEIPDLKYTLKRMLQILKNKMPDMPIFSGEFSRLLYIREVLKRDYGIN